MAEHGEGGGMIQTVLKYLFIFMALGLLVIWLLAGGAQKAWDVGKSFSNPLAFLFGSGTSSLSSFTLPWQPKIDLAPDISQYTGQASLPSSDENNVSAFGSPSPYAGEVSLTSDHPSTNAGQEYVVITSSASAPVSIAGWTLQSAASKVQVALPEAAPIFIGGVVNSVAPVILAPGGSAIVITGVSPVGVSFEENECSGYLGRFQNFTPALSDSCPAPADALPETPQNVQTYGASCFDYLSSLDSCATPGTTPPSDLSASCQSFVATTLTYNGCVGLYRSSASFALPTWRLYFGLAQPIWNPSHDVIRLLDDQSRVVDVLTY